MFPREAGRKEADVLSDAATLWPGHVRPSLPTIVQSSQDIETHSPSKEGAAMLGLIIYTRFQKLPWASWKPRHHSFQILNQGQTSNPFNYKSVVITGTACTA